LEHNIGGYDLLHPLEGLHLPSNSSEWPSLITANLEHKAANIIIDELDPEERVGFLINSLDLLHRIGLNEFLFNFPDHFIPGTRLTIGTSMTQTGFSTASAMFRTLMQRAEPGFKTRGLLMTEAYNRAFQLGAVEFGFNAAMTGEPDVKLLLVYPLRMDRWGTQELQLPVPSNGVVRVTTMNRLRRDSLLEFFTGE
jgi:hypothetical protein